MVQVSKQPIRLHRDAPPEVHGVMLGFIEQLRQWDEGPEAEEVGQLVTFGPHMLWLLYKCMDCGELHYVVKERGDE